MENKFKEGELVYTRSTPKLKLVIKRFASKIYYCQIPDVKDPRDLMLEERELEKIQDEEKLS